MKAIRTFIQASLFLFLPLSLQAQTYDKWWKEVETLQQKDLPQSVIKVLDKIYAKAEDENALPQRIKARLMRMECMKTLAPDSVEVERKRLKEWAERETDPVGRAMLYSLWGTGLSEQGRAEDSSEAVKCFRLSLQDRELLGRTPAKDFVPMTVAGRLSERYLGDSMYDLLTREAVRGLAGTWSWKRSGEVQEEIVRMYDGLLDFYAHRNREGLLMTRLAKAEWQTRTGMVEKRYRLTDEEYARLLDTWMQEFADLDVCAEVYLKRALLYRRKGELKQAHRLAEEGAKKYPKSETVAALKGLAAQIETPALGMDIPFVYPAAEAQLRLSYKNLRSVRMEVYRLALSPESPELNRRDYDADFVRRYGKRVSTEAWALQPTDDFRETDTVVRYRMPEAGIYLLKLMPEGHEAQTVYEVMYVSPYQCVSLPADEVYTELTAVDKRTGRPVPGAEIVTYEEKNGRYETVAVHTADAKGRVRVMNPEHRVLSCNVRTPGNNFMAIGRVASRSNWNGAVQKEWSRKASLFTDRALYRPGQTVYVSGVVYRQSGDSLQVAAGEEGETVLHLNRKEWKKVKVRTDEFGTFTAGFVLPQTVLPGEAWVSAYGQSEYFRVEEYKRPTFDVKWTPYAGTYAMGDSIEVEGQAQTFAGAPVRNGEVLLKAVRAQRWFWTPAVRRGEEIQTATVRTDKDGRFVWRVCLTEPEAEEGMERIQPYYIYTLEAEVTDGAGETQRGKMVLPVGSCAVGLQIEGLNGQVAREKNEKITFRVQNLNGMPVDAEVAYRVFALGKDRKQGDRKAEGKVRSQTAFVPQQVWQLPAGMYRMEASVCDGQGRECKAAQDFVLFSLEERRMPVDSVEWFYREQSVWDETHPVNLYAGSSEDSVYLFVDVYTAEKRIDSKRMYLNNEVVKLSYPYRKEYGNGITVHLAFLRNGEWHSRRESLWRPEPEKELRMKWTTFRDRLTPGTREEWRMQVADRQGKPVRANLMAVLYDASPDKLYGHDWRFSLHFPRFVPYIDSSVLWNGQWVSLYAPFSYAYAGTGVRVDEWGDYSRLWKPEYDTRETVVNSTLESNDAVEMKFAPSIKSAVTGAVPYGKVVMPEAARTPEQEALMEAEESIALPLRENFAETAFFYPQLRTDSTGQVSMVFTLPDALTTWRWMGFAHTKTMDYGLMTDTVVASKSFMVQPNLPRFVRAGDRTSVAVSLVNLSTEEVKGTARMQLIDPMTDKVVYAGKEKFRVKKGETGQVHFVCEVTDRYEVLICKVVAEAGDYTDGEQHYLPVLTDKQWITETIPLQLDGTDTLTVRTEGFFNHRSPTAADRRLTVELTAHPDWYVMQALPVLAQPAADDALAWASSLYANALSAYMIEARPSVGQMLKSGQAGGEEGIPTFLEKNADLKNLWEEESPWLAEAARESDRNRQTARLSDRNQTDLEYRTAIGKLKELQREDGSWSWYKGMDGNLYVTTQVAEMLTRLYALTHRQDAGYEAMYARAVGYLKEQAEEDYERLRKQEEQGMGQGMPRTETVRFLYMNALCPDKVVLPARKVTDYLLEKLERQSASTVYEKSLWALIMQANGKHRKAGELIQSIKEYTVYTEEMGRYFDTPKAAYSWSSYRIPTQTAALEAIHRLAPDGRMEAEMKQWLLKQKQVQVWDTPIATADAVYAFLCLGEDSPEEPGRMTLTIDDTTYRTPQDAPGAMRRTWTGKEAAPSRLTIGKTGKGIGWGAVYVQYTEQADRVQADGGKGLTVEREYWKDGKNIDGTTVLKPGDKLTVRLTVRADRDMDFVHLKDSRAACMEPVEQLSGYRRSGDTGYYCVSRDASTRFFIDKLRKGTHVLEYEVYIDRSGTYRAGMASVQSVYAPEFAAHTGGEKLTVSFCGD